MKEIEIKVIDRNYELQLNDLVNLSHFFDNQGCKSVFEFDNLYVKDSNGCYYVINSLYNVNSCVGEYRFNGKYEQEDKTRYGTRSFNITISKEIKDKCREIEYNYFKNGNKEE